MKKLTFTIILIVFPIVCYSQQGKWEKTLKKNNIESYKKFIEKNPESEYFELAKQKLIDLEYNYAVQINKIYKYEYFLKRYDNNVYTDDVLTRLDDVLAGLIEIEYHKLRGNQQRNEFILKYSNKDLPKKAERYINLALSQNQYNKIRYSNSLKPLKKYLSDYPDGYNADAIQRKIFELEEKEREKFKEGNESGASELLREYIEKYPNGTYLNQVRKKLNTFSWQTLSVPTLLSWKQIGIEPLSKAELNEIVQEGFMGAVKMTGYLQSGGKVVAKIDRNPKFSWVFFTDEGVEIEGFKVIPTYVYLSQIGVDSKKSLIIKIKEGYVLPQANMKDYISIGSIIDFKDQYTPIDLYGFLMKAGTIRVVENGLEIQAGSEVFIQEKSYNELYSPEKEEPVIKLGDNEFTINDDFTNDACLFEIDDNKYYLSNFLRLYDKNKSDKLEWDAEEYFELYLNFKLKVKEAIDLEMHKPQDFVNELQGYKNKLMTEHSGTDLLFLEQEYFDGILLFEISDSIIWKETVRNKDGVFNYYMLNRDKYSGIYKNFEALEKSNELGKIISNYQRALETNWIRELRNRHAISINNDIRSRLPRYYEEYLNNDRTLMFRNEYSDFITR